MAKSKDVYKIIAQNKKVYHDYFVEQTFVCGIVLAGTEVKSLRQGKGSVKESFVRVLDKEIYILNMHITPYEHGNKFNKDPIRTRKLLLNRYEINKIQSEVSIKGYTLMPLKLYLSGSLIKVEIGLCKGKKLHDKRRDIAKKDQRRASEQDFKVKNL